MFFQRSQIMNKIKTKIFQTAPEIFRDYPVCFAYLYGSYATEYEHPFSDLDICIHIDNIPPRGKLRLQMAIALRIDEVLGVGIDSDVRILDDLPLIIKGQIVTEGLLIYSINDDLRANVELFIRRAYFDFLPVTRKYRQSYINRVIS